TRPKSCPAAWGRRTIRKMTQPDSLRDKTDEPQTGADGDRRRRRSSDPLVALHYQLAHASDHGKADAMVVADDSGVTLAGSGPWALCEELAAYAPLLAQDVWCDPGLEDCGSMAQLAKLRTEVDVRRVDVEGQ